MIIETNLLKLIKAGAMTVYPFIFVLPIGTTNYEREWKIKVLLHERIHYNQQRRWLIYGIGIGLLAWWFLYLFCLPIKYNYFRRKWETEAFRTEGRSEANIKETLKHAPYYLT